MRTNKLISVKKKLLLKLREIKVGGDAIQNYIISRYKSMNHPGSRLALPSRDKTEDSRTALLIFIFLFFLLLMRFSNNRGPWELAQKKSGIKIKKNSLN